MLSSRQRQYLNAMGVDVWLSYDSRKSTGAQATREARHSYQLAHGTLADWLQTQPVKPVVNLADGSAKLVVIVEVGDSPNSDLSAFGPATELFDAMLKAIQMTRADIVLVELAMKAESNDRAFVDVLGEIQPAVILFMAALPHECPVTDFSAYGVHQQACCGVPLVVSLHPSYLLSNPVAKRMAWEDLKKVRGLLME